MVDDRFVEILNMDEDMTLPELIDVSILQKMQDAFAKMARMAALITDENGIAITNGTNFSDLCGYCRQSAIGKCRCENCDKMGAMMTLENHKPVSYKCHAHLVDFAAPIMMGEKVVGIFVGGQVLSEPPVEEEIRQVAREIEVDENLFWEAAQRVQVIPQAAIERVTDFLYAFSHIMSDMAYNAYVSKQLSKEVMQVAVQKQDFLANMSHEIRTPMNAVLGMAEMALRESMSQEAKNYITQIQSSGKHLLAIINDILDFSKIDSGKMTINNVIYETEELIEDLANVVNSRIGEKDIEFLIDVPCDMPIEMYGDYVRIHQILINLLNNAVKFTHSGCIKLRLRFEKIDEENVLFKADVIDTGNGIREEDIKKLFNSFQQVDSKRNRNVEGTGLGLAISKQLVELMGGTISVESVFGKGSTFSVEFPQNVHIKGEMAKELSEPLQIYLYMNNGYLVEQIRKDLTGCSCVISDLGSNEKMEIQQGSVIITERKQDKEEIEKMAETLPEVTFVVIESYDSPNDLKGDNIKNLKKTIYSKKLLAVLGMATAYSRDSVSDDEIFSFVAPEAKILIVDDNEINLTVAKGLLAPLNMHVDTALGATDCVNLIQNNKYDIIFMDHMMPGVDGIETTHIIRRMYSNYADVPIIALTANATSDAQALFIAEGMNDFVAKPIETKKLVAKVRQWLPIHMVLPVDFNDRKLEDVAKEDSVVDKIDIPGLNVKGAMELLRNEKLYLNFLKEYYLSIDTKAQKIQAAFDSGDIHTYTIEVHALKSSSRQIGAEALASDAEKLEKAGNANDVAMISEKTPQLLQDYMELKEKLSVLYESETSEETKTFDGTVVAELLEKMENAIAEFDVVSLEDIWREVDQYSVKGEEEEQLLVQLKAVTEEFDEDGFQKLAECWRGMY